MRQVLSFLLLCVAIGVLAIGVPASAGPAPSAPAPDMCGPDLRSLVGGACTHGGDLVPSVVERRALRFEARATTQRAGSIAAQMCAGNGRRGPRIRVFYGFPSDTTSRASTFRSWIRQSVAMADANLDARTPGADGQHLRMYCERDRKVTVTAIRLLPIADDATFTFNDTIASLTQRVANGLGSPNHDAPRVTYVVFVDNVTCCYGPAGQGTLYYDDIADPGSNANNQTFYGPRFAMVEIGGSSFSGAYVFLHEVGHTLGAVQLSSPHSSGAAHCYTSNDIMCYADGGPWFDGGGTMQPVCAAMPDGQFPFDCEGGDYYETDPGPGTYLDTHWNVADSAWLTRPD